jgi:DNA-binding NtrC family response regulator
MKLGKKVLLVDDEEGILEVGLRVITELGFDVDIASDGKIALDHLMREKGGYEMVITDVSMPNMGGRELAGRVKRLYPKVDIIMMTGYPDIESAVETLKEGAYDYLVKPLDIDVLAACVNRCWEKRQMAAALDVERTLRADIMVGLRQPLADMMAELEKPDIGRFPRLQESAQRLKAAIEAISEDR